MTLDEVSLLMPIKANQYKHQIKAFGFVYSLFGIFNAPFYSRGAALLMEIKELKNFDADLIIADDGDIIGQHQKKRLNKGLADEVLFFTDQLLEGCD